MSIRMWTVNAKAVIQLDSGVLVRFPSADSVNIKILNAGAWSRSSEKVFVSLPTELEDLIPEVEDFYKKNHSGRKLHWHHLMSNGIVSVTLPYTIPCYEASISVCNVHAVL